MPISKKECLGIQNLMVDLVAGLCVKDLLKRMMLRCISCLSLTLSTSFALKKISRLIMFAALPF